MAKEYWIKTLTRLKDELAEKNQALTAEVEGQKKHIKLLQDCDDTSNEIADQLEAQEKMLSEKDASIRMQTKRHKCDQTQLGENLKVCNRLTRENVAFKAALEIAIPELKALSKMDCTGGWDSCGVANHTAIRAEDLLEILEQALKESEVK